MNKGCVQIYTGEGKGKTTAALGLSIRAAGAGLKVFFAQFIKGKLYSEINVVNKISNITLKQYGLDCFIEKEPTAEDIIAARKGLQEVEAIINKGDHDVIILDEINIALYYKLFSVEELIAIIRNRPDKMEIVLTGRKAPKELIEIADLVTNMVEVKHYYNEGIEARKGIEY